ncbi:hypothetical protein FHU40_000826 [Nocardioides soli]|uniref:Uncharacterized protein n=1 Tax=Nocardioides soli TaxID=1036020 RepID=A0A7W4VSV2_9ACTN|nr:hypothetical protein [Nocardioides soli]
MDYLAARTASHTVIGFANVMRGFLRSLFRR